VDTAERPEEIDANRARRAADEAKEALLQKRSIQEYHAAQANLSRALSRLRVKHRYGGGS
jgi:F-type H+-transporting ATPase subunit epsilon